ncbi:hypothetical protein FB45DRAFT_1051463 [Roridomyces roridus]|uniref:AAA-ATPase-like domain-containing protein n=1 Tax=Roridomyces roridus TaxID=1738132 RepID=A0AAD7CE82_9AGAR|nr:hypothetical protein FB45DRAFT_1051463 [Roridomyces roridus]
MSNLVDASADKEPFTLHPEETKRSQHSKPAPTGIPHWELRASDDDSEPSSPSNGLFNSNRRSQDDHSEPPRKRVKTRSLSSSDNPRLPQVDDTFLDFRVRPCTAFVNKTRFAFQLPSHYRYLLLRPPKFGKTTFLSMFNQFYDVHGAETFSNYFDTADNLCHTNSEHSQHLCLPITLSDISVFSNSADFASSLRCTLLNDVHSFLVKYAQELGFSEPPGNLEHRRYASLQKVLELVKSHGKTLFVSVDSYDAPLGNNMRSHILYPGWQDALVKYQEIAELMDEYLWSPLRAGGDVVAKLLVAGTLSVQTHVLRELVTPAPDHLQSCCGFTESEAIQLAQSVDHTLDFAELRRRHGDYYFASDQTVEDIIFSPQVLIDHISGSSSSRKPLFDLLGPLLKLVPMQSDKPNTVTQEGLIELLATGVVEIESAQVDGLNDLDGNSVFWGALSHAGALTHSGCSKSTFRIANPEALSLIHDHIDRLAHESYDPYDVFGGDPDGFDGELDERFNFATALDLFDFYNTREPLLNLLSQALRHQTLGCLGKKHEPTLRGILELLMRNNLCMSSESLRRTEPIILLPAGVTCVRIFGDSPEHIREWELTTLTLHGMWRGANPIPNDAEPSVDALRVLFEELRQEDEGRLLARPYRELGAVKASSVYSFFKPETEYTQLIAVGGARILWRPSMVELTAPTPVEDENVDGWGEWDVSLLRFADAQVDYSDFAAEDEAYFTALNDTGSIPEEALQLSDCVYGPNFDPEQFEPEDEEWALEEDIQY